MFPCLNWLPALPLTLPAFITVLPAEPAPMMPLPEDPSLIPVLMLLPVIPPDMRTPALPEVDPKLELDPKPVKMLPAAFESNPVLKLLPKSSPNPVLVFPPLDPNTTLPVEPPTLPLLLDPSTEPLIDPAPRPLPSADPPPEPMIIPVPRSILLLPPPPNTMFGPRLGAGFATTPGEPADPVDVRIPASCRDY